MLLALAEHSRNFAKYPVRYLESEYQWRDSRFCRDLGKIRYPIRVVPSSLRSLNLNNFHFTTVFQVG